MVRRSFILSMAVAMLVMAPGAALADHPAVPFTTESFPGSSAVNSGGDDATWELLGTLFTGSPHTDIDYFTQDGIIYGAVGTLAVSGTAGGQTIIQLTDENGDVAPSLVSQHPSASCPSLATGVTGLQHDIEATPKGGALLNTDWGGTADTSDTQLLLDATDAPGRCHDNGVVGQSAPSGGVEIIDVTDVTTPVEIGLTVHIGEAHTINIDPKRPHILYVVSSDGVNYDGTTRQNEVPENADGEGQDLDGFEIVDLSSCMDFADGTSVEDKRGLDTDGETLLADSGCRPEVYRYRYPVALPGHTDTDVIYACHELEVYPDDRLTCASGNFTGLFDVSGAFDDNGTPDDFTDDTVNGDPLPCDLRASSSTVTPTLAPVIDCQNGADGADLSVPGWIDLGSPSIEGIEFLGAAFHQGRAGTTELPPFGADQDIDFSHEAELTHSRNFIISTDERGGGILPPDASCTPPTNVPESNGGLYAYAVDRLDGSTPPTPEDGEGEAFDPFARTPEGDKAIFRVTPRVPAASFCTAHVFHQIPGQNRIFMAWYSQGTVVVDFEEGDDGTLEFSEAGYFIPENANTWVSAVFKVEENEDGSFTYYGATGDFILGNTGRNAIDVYSVTLPAPPTPADPTATTDDPSTTPDPVVDDTASDDGGLAATGGGTAALAIGLSAIAGALLGRRRRA